MRLFTRNANDFTDRFPFIATAVAELPVKSCLIEGEAIVCDENGLAVFDLIRRHGAGERAVLSAFDLLELDGKDLRSKPIETRKALLAKLLNGSHLSLSRAAGRGIAPRKSLTQFDRIAFLQIDVFDPRQIWSRLGRLA